MDKWDFGFTMMIVGMGGTFVTLYVMTLIMELLKKVFPMAEKAANTPNPRSGTSPDKSST